MSRPPVHWYVGGPGTDDHPLRLAGFRSSACDGVIRRLYVRRAVEPNKKLRWEAIGYVCDGCGELGIDRAWRARTPSAGGQRL